MGQTARDYARSQRREMSSNPEPVGPISSRITAPKRDIPARARGIPLIARLAQAVPQAYALTGCVPEAHSPPGSVILQAYKHLRPTVRGALGSQGLAPR